MTDPNPEGPKNLRNLLIIGRLPHPQPVALADSTQGKKTKREAGKKTDCF
jgi:hypothetical protein